MLLRLRSFFEKILLELLVVLIDVLLVDFHGGKSELPAVDQSRLKFVVGEVVKSQPPLLQSLIHQGFYRH